jgi:hypothetical protein
MSVEVAATAVALLGPYLTEAGKEAAKAVGKETASAGLKLLGWPRQGGTRGFRTKPRLAAQSG